MKRKLLLTVVAILSICIPALSQNTINNYHFCDEPGELVTEPSYATFIGTSPGWERSHGSPNWGKSYINMLTDNPKTGEGIFQNFAFRSTGYYKIKIYIT